MVRNSGHISFVGSQFLVSNSHSFKLQKVYHVPFIYANLINVAKFCSNNKSFIEFYPNSSYVNNQLTKRVLAQCKLENGLSKFPVSKSVHNLSHNFFNNYVSTFTYAIHKAELWHCRLRPCQF